MSRKPNDDLDRTEPVIIDIVDEENAFGDDGHDADKDRVVRAVEAMLNGDTDVLFDGGVMETIAMEMAAMFTLSPRKRDWHRFSSRLPHDAKSKDAVLDIVMANSYAGESLAASVSRLAKAAWLMGFETLTPFAAMCAYRTFGKELKNEYKRRKKASARRG